MIERRTRKDRRSWERNQILIYPFIDCNGIFVEADRRVIPDRRLNNIESRWLPITLRKKAGE